MEYTNEDIKHHVRVYVSVFAALMVMTVLTVAVSYLHLPVGYAIALALVIAAVKGTLVAANFMHLLAERKIIYYALVLTVIFFIVLMFLPMLAYFDPIVYKQYVS